MATEEELPEAAEAAPAPAPAPAPAGGGGGDDAEMPDAAAPSASDSDSLDSDSDDEGPAGADELRIQDLEKTLQGQPLDYDTHVQYIQCLRKSGNIEKLRAAREEMNKYFPLTPKMWQEWAKDEISLSSSEESFGDIEKLYERGVQEYLSIKLWRDYLDYVEEHDQSVSQCTPSGLSKMRNLFESAITAGGLHVTEGSKLWAAYREYEMAILITIADANDEEREKQVQRIRTLFHRQLSVPLADMDSTLTEYKSWEAEQGNANDPGADFDGVPSNVVSAYKKANDMYNERKQYEDQLSNPGTSEADKLQQFVKYIKFEESSGDPARVQVLSERAVSELPVSSDIWMGYTSYLDRTLKVPSVLRSVYHRATRRGASSLAESLDMQLPVMSDDGNMTRVTAGTYAFTTSGKESSALEPLPDLRAPVPGEIEPKSNEQHAKGHEESNGNWFKDVKYNDLKKILSKCKKSAIGKKADLLKRAEEIVLKDLKQPGLRVLCKANKIQQNKNNTNAELREKLRSWQKNMVEKQEALNLPGALPNNSTRKYKEDQKVPWHSTPYDDRIEKAVRDDNLVLKRTTTSALMPLQQWASVQHP